MIKAIPATVFWAAPHAKPKSTSGIFCWMESPYGKKHKKTKEKAKKDKGQSLVSGSNSVALKREPHVNGPGENPKKWRTRRTERKVRKG